MLERESKQIKGVGGFLPLVRVQAYVVRGLQDGGRHIANVLRRSTKHSEIVDVDREYRRQTEVGRR